jgi:DNA gyrase subunit A
LFDLKKAEARAHILEGFMKALENLDAVVKIIRESNTRAEAAETLIARFEFSKAQADAILEMRLYQLTGMSVIALKEEYEELRVKIDYLHQVIGSREMRLGIIKEELLQIKAKYADPRRTEITMDDSDLNIADLIPRHSCVITVSNTGYIKRVPADTYRTQHRGGKGIIGMETKEEDYVEHLFNAHSHDLIFFFTDRGFMYWLNVYEIPEGSRTGKGRAIINMIKINQGEKICAMMTVSQSDFENPNKYIVLASRRGYIKKSELALFKNLRRVGLRALVIEEDDDLIGAGLSENGNEILLSTRFGMACRFDQTDEEIRPMGRTARGVTGMRFKLENDDIVSLEIIREQLYEEASEDDESESVEMEVEVNDDLPVVGFGPEVLVVTTGGMGKRSYVSGYRKTRRGAKGVVNIKLREGEEVLSVVQIKNDDEILLTTERGQLVRIPASEIRLVGRASKGVRIMNLNEGDRITGVARLVKVEVESNAISEEEFLAARAEVLENQVPAAEAETVAETAEQDNEE